MLMRRPRITTRFELPYLAVPDDFILIGSEFGEGKWPAAVQLLSADAHLGSEAEFAAVGESGGRVPIDRSGVNLTEELSSASFIGSDNRIGVFGRILVDVSDGFAHVCDNGDCHAHP